VYIPGSYSAPGTTDYIPNGIEEAAATTGTFQGLSRTTYPQWAGTDGRDGTTTTAALSEQMLMAGAAAQRAEGRQQLRLPGRRPGRDRPVHRRGSSRSGCSTPRSTPSSPAGRASIFGGAGGLKPFPLIGDMYSQEDRRRT
jgi:hypothetical protein